MGQWDDLIATILTDRSAESQHLLETGPESPDLEVELRQ